MINNQGFYPLKLRNARNDSVPLKALRYSVIAAFETRADVYVTVFVIVAAAGAAPSAPPVCQDRLAARRSDGTADDADARTGR